MADNRCSLGGRSSTSSGRAPTPEIIGSSASPASGPIKSPISGQTANTSKAPTALVRGLEQELPENAVCLMDCEAAEILQGIQDKMAILSQYPDVKLPGSFAMGLLYAKSSGNQLKYETVKRILQPLKKHGVSDCEFCLIANNLPASEDEVLVLIPSLKCNMQKLKDPIRIALLNWQSTANLAARTIIMKVVLSITSPY